MVKKNKVLIGCLSLLLVLSVGYALFSETIEINGTATAKGSFDISTTCVPGYSSELVALGIPSVDYNQAGFENSICDVNGNTVTMSTDLLYPTAKRFFTVKMENTGSIPAVIWVPAANERFLVYDHQADWAVKNKETEEIIKSGTGPDIRVPEHSGHQSFVSSWTTIVMSSAGQINADSNVVYDSSRDFVGIKLNPGDVAFSGTDFIYPELSDHLMSDNGKSEYLDLNLNYEFNWEQYTDSPNYEPTTFNKWCFYKC